MGLLVLIIGRSGQVLRSVIVMAVNFDWVMDRGLISGGDFIVESLDEEQSLRFVKLETIGLELRDCWGLGFKLL
jgi:hypothetical protein